MENLDGKDHYCFLLWEKMGWPSSELRLKMLDADVKKKRRNIKNCKAYRESGARLRARGKNQSSNLKFLPQRLLCCVNFY